MICRVCLKENSSVLNIFDGNSESVNIAKVLAKHFWFEVNKEYFRNKLNSNY